LLVTGFILVHLYGCEKEDPVTLPELSTLSFTGITSVSVISGGKITSEGGALVTSRGVCWASHPNPTLADSFTSDGTGAGSYTSSITGLSSGIDYFIRAYAINSAGTAYGNEFHFITPVTDIDGNLYSAIIIGKQVWMSSNLKTTKLNDNTGIPQITVNASWSTLSTPAYCWYKNDEDYNRPRYGALYNWFAVSSDKLCPAGWHVPDEEEWKILSENVGGVLYASGNLKEKGTLNWTNPNTGATDHFGFTALPGGYRTGLASGSFRTRQYYGWWWTRTEYDLTGARARLMTYEESEIVSGTGLKRNGYSVRCIKD
jgi:uncharacterized protein (TIGR02145 family)